MTCSYNLLFSMLVKCDHICTNALSIKQACQVRAAVFVMTFHLVHSIYSSCQQLKPSDSSDI